MIRLWLKSKHAQDKVVAAMAAIAIQQLAPEMRLREDPFPSLIPMMKLLLWLKSNRALNSLAVKHQKQVTLMLVSLRTMAMAQTLAMAPTLATTMKAPHPVALLAANPLVAPHPVVLQVALPLAAPLVAPVEVLPAAGGPCELIPHLPDPRIRLHNNTISSN